jgi:hypothetical protein
MLDKPPGQWQTRFIRVCGFLTAVLCWILLVAKILSFL